MTADEAQRADERFRPLRPASGARRVAAIVLGPFAWFAALCVVAWLVDKSDAIELGLLVTLVSFAVSAVVLALLYRGRRREERRYERGG